jgi:hypothetical protein
MADGLFKAYGVGAEAVQAGWDTATVAVATEDAGAAAAPTMDRK